MSGTTGARCRRQEEERRGRRRREFSGRGGRGRRAAVKRKSTIPGGRYDAVCTISPFPFSFPYLSSPPPLLVFLPLVSNLSGPGFASLLVKCGTFVEESGRKRGNGNRTTVRQRASQNGQ